MKEDNKGNLKEERYLCLRLDHQLCFPLYACSKEIVRKYKRYLDQLDLTYTQYLVMMVLWEKKHTNVKELGKCLFLDSGTLTPVLKKLENKGMLTRRRSEADERSLIVSITEKGEKMQDDALFIPEQMGKCVQLNPEEAAVLYKLLYKVLGNIEA